MARRLHIPSFDHLRATMVGNYKTWTAHAAALLEFARGVHPASRLEVMEFILTEFGYVDSTTCAGVTAVEAKDVSRETYEAVSTRIRPIVKTFCDTLMRENPTEASFVQQVVKFLDELPSNAERVVAFSLILQGNTTPYVQLPSVIDRYRATPLPADDDRMYERSRVMRSLKVIIRVLNGADTVSEIAQVLYGIISEHRDPDEARFLLWNALHHQRAQQPPGGAFMLAMLGRAPSNEEATSSGAPTHGHELCKRPDCTLCSSN